MKARSSLFQSGLEVLFYSFLFFFILLDVECECDVGRVAFRPQLSAKESELFQKLYLYVYLDVIE